MGENVVNADASSVFVERSNNLSALLNTEIPFPVFVMADSAGRQIKLRRYLALCKPCSASDLA